MHACQGFDGDTFLCIVGRPTLRLVDYCLGQLPGTTRTHTTGAMAPICTAAGAQ